MPPQFVRKRFIQPMLQGDLDGLCGPYAVINALRSLCPELDYATSEQLFTRALRVLAVQGGRSLDVAVNGIGKPLLEMIADDLVGYLRRVKAIDVRLRHRRLQTRTNSLDEKWRALAQMTDARSVVIIGLSGCCSHWTVLFRVDETHLYLIDSSFRRQIARERCTTRSSTTRYRISRSGLIVLTRA